MYFQLSLCLSVFYLIFAREIPNTSDNEIVASNIYDDIELEQIKGNLSLLQDITKNLIKKIDLQDQNLNQIKTLLNEMNNKQNLNTQKMNDLINTRIMQNELLLTTNFNKLNEQIEQQQQVSRKYFREWRVELAFSDCTEALEYNNGKNGIYEIKVENSTLKPFDVYCLRNLNNKMYSESYTDWMIIQRRMDGSVDFYRNWTDYQEGFGNLDGEFFIGLNKLHALTKYRQHELWIQLEKFEGEKRWAKYSHFSVGNETEAYELKSLGTYTGDAGDALAYHINQKWSTKDVDNDKDDGSCSTFYKGAWWFRRCHDSDLNGMYLHGALEKEMKGKGVTWHTWPGSLYSPKYAHMAIRPVS